MNAGPTAERVYATLKRAIMERGFRPGARLDPGVLAEELNSSTTPVREALCVLTGEGLVEAQTGGGFFIPQLDEPGLEDLYDWSGDLLALAIRASAGGAMRIVPPRGSDGPVPLAERTASLFLDIARRSANSEHGRAVAAANARLHAVRTVEPRVVDETEEELSIIAAALAKGEAAPLRRAVTAYHRRRRRAAADIVRAVYRAA